MIAYTAALAHPSLVLVSMKPVAREHVLTFP